MAIPTAHGSITGPTVEQQLAQVVYDVCSYDAHVRAAALSTHFAQDAVLTHPAVIVKGRQRVGHLYRFVTRVCLHIPVVHGVHVINHGSSSQLEKIAEPSLPVQAFKPPTTTAGQQLAVAPARGTGHHPGCSRAAGPHQTPSRFAGLLHSRSAARRRAAAPPSSPPESALAPAAAMKHGQQQQLGYQAAMQQQPGHQTAMVHLTQRLRPYVLFGVMLSFPETVVVRFTVTEGCGTVVIQQQEDHVDVNGLCVHLPWRLATAFPVMVPLQLVLGWVLITLVAWLDWLLGVAPRLHLKGRRVR